MYKINTKYLIFLFIFFLGISLRLWKLQDYPVHLSHDEVSQVYDAISIAETGKDIHGDFLPTIFTSIGDYKSPFYTYATALVYLMIGNYEWMIRVVGVIFGILIIPAVFWFTLKLTKKINIALFASFFVAISPSEVLFSRKSFENVAGIFFALIAFAFFFSYFENQKKLRFLYLGVTFSAFSMYTYFSHAIILPLMLGAFFFIYKSKLDKNLKKYLPAFSLWVLLIVPLILIVITNPASRYRSQAVFVTQDSVLRSSLNLINSDSNFLSEPLSLKKVVDYSFDRYLRQFDPIYIFGNGLDLTEQGLLDVGPLLLLQLPLLLLAIIYLAKGQGNRDILKLLFLWIIIALIPSGLAFESHSPHRIVIVFTLMNILTGIGVYWLWQKLNSFKQHTTAVWGILVMLIIVNEVFFLHIYFVNNPYEKSQYIQYPIKQVAEFAWSQYGNADLIVFDPYFGEINPFIAPAAQYYLAYYGNYPPEKFQKEYRIGSKNRETLFGKFSIREINWIEDKHTVNTLFIGSPWSIPIESVSKDKILKTFYLYNGQPAFYAVKL